MLNHAVGVYSGVPYEATISQGGKAQKGHVIFSDKGRFTFDFFYGNDLNSYRFLPRGGDANLDISSLEEKMKVHFSGVHPMPLSSGMVRMTRVSGELADTILGLEVEGLTSLTFFYAGIPTDWPASVPWSYLSGYTEEPDTSAEKLSWASIDAIVLQYRDWCVRLMALIENDVIDGVRHIAHVERKHPFSGKEAEEFASTNLQPFLSFLFGSNPKVVFAYGTSDYRWLWGFYGHDRYPRDRRRITNWFAKVDRDYDPSDIFARFCSLNVEDRNIMANMINHYAASEEIVSSATYLAVVGSFSALEGLVRWIGYSHADIREEFFLKPKGRKERDRQEQERRLAKYVSLPDVIVRVLECENLIDEGRKNDIKDVVKTLQDIRDSIAHVTIMHQWDGTQLYYAWNKSQFLVEALILRKLGYTGPVPNRTRMWKFVVDGEDLTKQERDEGELWLDSSDERETGETE